ncbi:MAG: hypothetical protein ACFB2Y_13115, partial [Fulvivirga sp.]
PHVAKKARYLITLFYRFQLHFEGGEFKFIVKRDVLPIDIPLLFELSVGMKEIIQLGFQFGSSEAGIHFAMKVNKRGMLFEREGEFVHGTGVLKFFVGVSQVSILDLLNGN